MRQQNIKHPVLLGGLGDGGPNLFRSWDMVAEPWPVNDLHVFDAPTEGEIDINFGPMLPDVMKA